MSDSPVSFLLVRLDGVQVTPILLFSFLLQADVDPLDALVKKLPANERDLMRTFQQIKRGQCKAAYVLNVGVTSSQ